MARARNIKHSFFINEDLADNDPLGRLLFIGLWTLADYKGDLEWKERTIKVQILPFDNCDIKKLAINLDKSGLVMFYSDQEKIYLHIPNFTKHQNPHPNERKKGSDIPEYSDSMRQAIDLKGLTINHDKSRQVSDESVSDNAESLILNPESCSLNNDSSDINIADSFQILWESFDGTFGNKGSKKKAEAVFKKLKPDRDMFNLIIAGLDVQLAAKRNVKSGGEFVSNFKHVERWLNLRGWEDEADKCTGTGQNPKLTAQERARKYLDELDTGQEGAIEASFERID